MGDKTGRTHVKTRRSGVSGERNKIYEEPNAVDND